MRQLVTAFVLLVLVSGAVLAQGDTQTDLIFTMTEANDAYANAEYENAIQLYEALINEGVRDAVVYFNLGNAYYQLGDLGRALLNYRRAQITLPRDPDLNRNLALVRSSRLDVQGDEVSLIDSTATVTTSIVTLLEFGWIVFTAWTIWLILLSVAILRKQSRDFMRVPLFIVGVVLVAGLFMFISRLYVSTYRPPAVVLVEEVEVRSGPGEEFLEIFELHSGAEVRLIDAEEEWYKFVLPDGRLGYVPRTAIGVI